ncbi:hypothetical protein ACHAW5_005237 [Stephanodiscus triporus]|uniref:Ricin B lectin domain-containing protein n=1 Tax=Stephanodiscus triporus TaxID=2934178 RepID=A0ABD3Q4A2_9STRA
MHTLDKAGKVLTDCASTAGVIIINDASSSASFCKGDLQQWQWQTWTTVTQQSPPMTTPN